MRRDRSSGHPAGVGTVAGAPVAGVGVALGALRCAFGAVMIGDPPRLAKLFGVDSVTARQTGWLTMMIGGREIALGVGSLFAVGRGRSAAGWYAAQAVTDGGDALALLTAVRRGSVSTPIGIGIALSAVAGVALNLGAMRAGGGEPVSR